jgi:hypothetical protein
MAVGASSGTRRCAKRTLSPEAGTIAEFRVERRTELWIGAQCGGGFIEVAA